MKKRSKQNNPEQKTLHLKSFDDPVKEVKQRNAKKGQEAKAEYHPEQ
ncbi:hypothetical protein GGR02_001793 [Anoxybacillus voinovskiensis]|uniref:Glycogen biosynthesis protein GlgD n=1 Tax=Anoxybacteroides voinovskiense TaxID=230470 RepID=A0A840DVK1_9BACL|nr:hypothetical protein [Anoxybacillus voinovskiensis]MBB4074028.1 hypothetical protein [Anoxybacillus voinovskiensis]GGJ68099.1 hypothetical protein GCM10008982_16780 [Anoxybacillus voinovskiensis]